MFAVGVVIHQEMNALVVVPIEQLLLGEKSGLLLPNEAPKFNQVCA